jgi:hypothetical protein
VIKDDALLGTFLAEPSFEQWRKRSSVSLEEESASERIDRVEEMTIPSDLEDKLGYIVHTPFATNLCSNRGSLSHFDFPLGMYDRGSPLSSRPGRRSVFWESASSGSARLQRYEAPTLGLLSCLICICHLPSAYPPRYRLPPTPNRPLECHWDYPPPSLRLIVSGPRAVPIVTFYPSGRLVASDEYTQDPGGGKWAMLEGPGLRFVRRRQAGHRCGSCAYSASS